MLSSFSLGLLCSLDVARLSSLNRLVLNHRNRPAVETNLSGLYLHSRSLLREKRVTVIFLFFSPLRFILFNALEMIAIVTRICEYIYIYTHTHTRNNWFIAYYIAHDESWENTFACQQRICQRIA